MEESVPMLVVNFLLPFEHSYMQDQVGGGQVRLKLKKENV